MFDIATGFTGFTIDVFNGSASDSEGDVTKALFAITFQERVNTINFSITDGDDHWSCLTPTGEYIAMRNPRVLFVNKSNAVVEFDMAEKYPSNSMLILAYRNMSATFDVKEVDTEEPAFVENTIVGCMGFTSNEYGGVTDDDGQVKRIVFNVPYTARRNDVAFEMSTGENDWAVLMGDGTYINLIEPHILYSNRDSATIVFQMESPYPSNAPGYLVRRNESAGWTITEIDDEYPFIPIQNIIFPSYIPAGERLNLSAQTVVYPMNASIRNIDWTVKNAGSTEATIESGWITTTNPGNIVLTATVVNGSGTGVNYTQDIEVIVIDNWIEIDQQPHADTYCTAGYIKEEISVVARTEYGDLTYQWYKSGDNTNEYGTAIANATSPTFKIPTDLIPGEYFYFCEIRKTNFPSVRTDVAHVKVRDQLFSISIYPSSASILPGQTKQFAIDRNPQTANEAMVVSWFSSDPSIVSIDEKGLATCHNPGAVIITARVENIETSISVDCVYVGVSAIDFSSLGNLIDTGVSYNMPTTVLPSNATYKDIEWSVVDAGSTGAVIIDNTLIAPKIGDIVVKGVIRYGLTPVSDFERTFNIKVQSAHVPVTDIILTDLGTPRAGAPLLLKPNVLPANASNKVVRWSIVSAGGTGATLLTDGILIASNSGTVTLKAEVSSGSARGVTYTKEFKIAFSGKFVPVDAIENFPSQIPYYDGILGYTLAGKVSPANAAYTTILYEISENDESGLAPQIDGNKLLFDSNGMSYTDQISILMKMTVKNGLSEGVDYVTESAIYISPPAAPNVFVPIVTTQYELPSILRAYRPILIDEVTIVPPDASQKSVTWGIQPTDDVNGSQAIQFIVSDDKKQALADTGVHFDEEYNWDYPGNIIYPMSKGGLKVKMEIFDGLGVNKNYVFEDTLNFLDPFIKVTGIKNIPSTIYTKRKTKLCPELDTGNGMDDETAYWDDREATFQDVTFEITKGKNLATVDKNGVITAGSDEGTITVRITVPAGRQEAYTWHGKEFKQIDYVESFQIELAHAGKKKNDPLVWLKYRENGKDKWAGVKNKAEFERLRWVGEPDETITIDGNTFTRDSIIEVEFSSRFEWTDLSNFGRNWTSLTKINTIPASATNLRNFLRGCTSFNQSITIPRNVNGDRCLEGFLRDCTSFDKRIKIPEVNGFKCLESFMRGCTSFNHHVILPEEISGDCCMYSFMQDCTAFNSQLQLPKRISGNRCMENVLRNCQSFNRNLVLPEEISGDHNMNAFMYNCNSFASCMFIPTAEGGAAMQNDVITFSTLYIESALATHGVDFYGPGAAAFKETIGDNFDTGTPRRIINLDGVQYVPDVYNTYYDITVDINSTSPYGYYADYLVGDNIIYKANITNISEAAVTGVKVSDDLPAQVTYKGASADRDGVTLTKIYDDGSKETVVLPETIADVVMPIHPTVYNDEVDDGKDSVEVTGVSSGGNVAYTGSAVAGYSGNPAAEGFDGEFEVLYVGNMLNEVAYGPTADMPTEVGAYAAIVKIPDSHETLKGQAVVNFMIEPAVKTVEKIIVNIGNMDVEETVSVVINAVANALSDTLINRVFINYDQENLDENDNITDYVDDSIVEEHEIDDSGDAEVCSHATAAVKGYRQPTATTKGYTGDTICTTCGLVIETGTEIDVLSATASDIAYGQSLAGSVISSDTEVAGSWAWEDKTLVPTEVGIYEANAVFTPISSAGTTVVLKLRIKVTKATPVVTVTVDPTSQTAGGMVTVETNVVNNSNDELEAPEVSSLTYKIGDADPVEITDGEFTVPEDAAKDTVITVTATTSEDDYYNEASSSVDVLVTEAEAAE